MTAALLSTKDEDYSIFLSLRDKRSLTDVALIQFDAWPESNFIPNVSLPTKEHFLVYLNDLRNTVEARTITEENSIRNYTTIVLSFMTWGEQNIITPEQGNIWGKVVAVTATLRASDAIGIRRALGAAYFMACGLSSDFYEWFSQLQGQADALMSFAFNMHLPASDSYGRDFIGMSLKIDLFQSEDK